MLLLHCFFAESASVIKSASAVGGKAQYYASPLHGILIRDIRYKGIIFMNIEKEKHAIEILKSFCPKEKGENYYLCYSGGKDSDCIRILAQLADVPHEIHYNLTTVDAPETMKYIKSIPNIIIDKAFFTDGTRKTMWNLIPRKLLPPTRLMRYCCQHLKEHGGKGRLKVTGVRWDESNARAENTDVIKIVGKEKTTLKQLEAAGVDYIQTKQGGVKMSYDNESVATKNNFVQQCYINRNVSVNPIVDWTEEDVWDFLHYYNCESNPLYQCGKTRIGCIGCPMQGAKKMRADFEEYPKYKENYIRAFERMLKIRNERELPNTYGWVNGEDVFKWWLSK